MANSATLGWIDYLVIALMLCISSGIGLYYRLTGGRQRTYEEYFNANRSMSILPVGIALMVSFMSAITLLGVSAENYTYGTQFVIVNLAYLIGTPVVCYGFFPVFYKLQATSAYEYLEKRFGVGARLTASFIYSIQILLYSGVVLYAPALALEATTGLSKTGSIIIIGLVCAFYSSVGGIKAVLITDVFQGALMFIALFVIIGVAANAVGGLGEIWRIAYEGGRIQFDSVSIDPTVRHTWWGQMIGGIFTYLSLYGVNQVQVQRMLTVRNLKSAQIAMWLNWPILAFLSICTCFSGLAIYSKYYNCDPVSEGRISSTDMLMPLYVMDTMSHIPGLPGLFVAGIFSAGLSTISAGLNSLSAVTLEDYIKPLYKKCFGYDFPLSKSIFLGKLLAFLFGLACIAVAFLAQYLGGILQGSLTIFGVVGGPLLGMFTLGMVSQTATQRGTITGCLVALTFSLWIAFGQPRPATPKLPVTTDGCNATVSRNQTFSAIQQAISLIKAENTDDSTYFYLYRLSYIWYSAIGFLVTVVVGLLVSNLARIILKEEKEKLNPDLFFTIIGNRMRSREKSPREDNGLSIIDLEVQKKLTFNGRERQEREKGNDNTSF